MSKIRCSNCGEEHAAAQLRLCKNCGTYLCPACAAGNHGMCNGCYSDLRYFH